MLSRSVGADGKEEFSILNSAMKQQLVISGYDPSLSKGGSALLTVTYREGKNVLLSMDCTATVVREEGSRVWLAVAPGQGFIIKK